MSARAGVAATRGRRAWVRIVAGGGAREAVRVVVVFAMGGSIRVSPYWTMKKKPNCSMIASTLFPPPSQHVAVSAGWGATCDLKLKAWQYREACACGGVKPPRRLPSPTVLQAPEREQTKQTIDQAAPYETRACGGHDTDI